MVVDTFLLTVLNFHFLTYKISDYSEYQVKYLNCLAQNLTHSKCVINVTFCLYTVVIGIMLLVLLCWYTSGPPIHVHVYVLG